MSNRALVAFQNADGTYDLHYSHDGATRLQLFTPLQIAARQMATEDSATYRDALASLDAPESKLSSDHGLATHLVQQDVAAQTDAESIQQADFSQLIEADPMAIDVEATALRKYVGPHYEQVYVVEPGDVTLLVPLWMGANLIEWLAEHYRIDVYDNDQFEPVARNADLDAATPDYTFEGDDYVETVVYDAPSPAYDALYTVYQDVGSTIAATASAREDSIETATIHTDGYVAQATLVADDIAWLPASESVLVEVPYDAALTEAASPEGAVEQFVEMLNEPEAVSRRQVLHTSVEAARENPDAYYDDEPMALVSKLVAMVVSEYPDRIATQFMEDPYQELVRDVRESLE